ncbi:MAG: GNAT family N-acetyltransferase [Armatimonadetes bacterium]|nr:GNAT family N-acetyltransferase [Armatimonadota bacterium]
MRICVDGDIELRLLELADAPALENLKDGYSAFRDEWLYRGDAEAFIRESMERHASGYGFWAGIRLSGELVGVVGLSRPHPHSPTANLDYMLGNRFRGRGIMTRSLQALIPYAFEELGLHRLEVAVDWDNLKSRAIPERLGFRQEGILREKICYGSEFGDCVLYALLAREWASQDEVRPETGSYRRALDSSAGDLSKVPNE